MTDQPPEQPAGDAAVYAALQQLRPHAPAFLRRHRAPVDVEEAWRRLSAFIDWRAEQQPPAPPPNGDGQAADGELLLMLIEFDDAGRSVGRSWPVTDPQMAEHLRHITSHLGAPMTEATNEQAATYAREYLIGS